MTGLAPVIRGPSGMDMRSEVGHVSNSSLGFPLQAVKLSNLFPDDFVPGFYYGTI